MTGKPNNPFRFWEELKRRKVIRIIIGYLASSYLILELASIVIEPLGLPGWTINLLLILMLAGFIIVVCLAWIFDFTSEGIKKTEPLKAVKVKPVKERDKRGVKTSDIIITLLLAGVCILAYPHIFKSDKFKELRNPDGRISLAVMPFENMTGDSSLDYFSDGISSLIINGLGNSQELAVLDDQAMFDVMESMDMVSKAQIMPVIKRDVAAKAKAETYIAGNYQGADTTYWIMANLYETKTNKIISTFRCEGNLKSSDYITIADQLSNDIKAFLEIRVLEQESAFEFREAYPSSPEAYRYFIEGMKMILTCDYVSAIESMERAMEIDSTFAFASFYVAFANNLKTPQDMLQTRIWTNKAFMERDQLPLKYQNWIGLWHACFESMDINEVLSYCKLLESSDLQSRFVWFDLGVTYCSFLEQHDMSVKAFEKIEQIDDDRGSDWNYQDFYYRYGQALHLFGDHKYEKEVFEKGLKMFPNNINKRDTYWQQVLCGLSRGDTIEANGFINKYIAVKKELGYTPDNIEFNLGNIHFTAKLMPEALEYYRKALELNPGNNLYRYYIARTLIHGDIDAEEGLRMIDKGLELNPDNEFLRWIKGIGLYKTGSYDESLAVLRRIRDEMTSYNTSIIHDIQMVEEAKAKLQSEL